MLIKSAFIALQGGRYESRRRSLAPQTVVESQFVFGFIVDGSSQTYEKRVIGY